MADGWDRLVLPTCVVWGAVSAFWRLLEWLPVGYLLVTRYWMFPEICPATYIADALRASQSVSEHSVSQPHFSGTLMDTTKVDSSSTCE